MRPARQVQKKNTTEYNLGDALLTKHGSASPAEQAHWPLSPQRGLFLNRHDSPRAPRTSASPGVLISLCSCTWSLTGSFTSSFHLRWLLVSGCALPECDVLGAVLAAITMHHKLEGLHNSVTVSQVWRLDVGRAGSFCGLWGKTCSLPPPSSLPVICWQSLAFLGLWVHHPNASLHVHRTFSLYPCLCPNLLGHHSHWMRGTPYSSVTSS